MHKTPSDCDMPNSPIRQEFPKLKTHPVVCPPTPESLKTNKIIKLDTRKSTRIRNIGTLLMNEKTKLEPSTPMSQLIDDEMIKQWNKSKKTPTDTSEDGDDEDGNLANMVDDLSDGAITNPFISTKQEAIKLHKQHEGVDYSKYNEYIDKSGKKVIKKLTQSEQRIKPKRLFTKEISLNFKLQNLNNSTDDFEIFKD
ncbi:hypothetical protein PSN45_003404 [Yamadazyma tenuis]|uniref:uncharacterized protein n=1 Tax=Candida tenuis TaxID=2315449 RepID=UPI0027A8E033|nr:hypothetical protein PSN45_003404 [Yamadazyma tenuis]